MPNDPRAVAGCHAITRIYQDGYDPNVDHHHDRAVDWAEDCQECDGLLKGELCISCHDRLGSGEQAAGKSKCGVCLEQEQGA